MTAEVRYVAAARAPAYIDIHAVYRAGRDEHGFYIQLADRREYMSESALRYFYAPINDVTWDHLLVENKKTKPVKRAAKPAQKSPIMTEDNGAAE